MSIKWFKGFGLLLSLPLLAQAPASPHSVNMGVVVSVPVGSIREEVHEGAGLHLGYEYAFRPFFGLRTEYGFASHSFTKDHLERMNMPAGSLSTYRLSLDPIYHLTPQARTNLYVMGGLGVVRARREYTTKPTTQDASFLQALFFRSGTTQRGAVLSSNTSNRLEMNAGLGMERRMASAPTARWYVEASCHVMTFDGVRYTFIPVVLGLRL